MAVEISWLANIEPDISGYELFRADEHDGNYIQIVEVPVTIFSYSDEGGATGQWYKVRAFNNRGARGPFGPEVQAIAIPTCRVYGHLMNLEGNALVGARVAARTRARRMAADALGTVVPDEVRVETDENGWWQMQLYPNSKLRPAGSIYVFEFKGGGYEFSVEAEVPDEEEVDFRTLIQ